MGLGEGVRAGWGFTLPTAAPAQWMPLTWWRGQATALDDEQKHVSTAEVGKDPLLEGRKERETWSRLSWQRPHPPNPSNSGIWASLDEAHGPLLKAGAGCGQTPCKGLLQDVHAALAILGQFLEPAGRGRGKRPILRP